MPASSKHERPIFVLALRPEPRVDSIRALRGALKMLKRRFGLRAVTIREHHAADAGIDRSAIKNRYGHGRERRAVFLERVGAMLKVRHRFTDLDVDEVAKLALTGLAHQPAA